MKKIAQYVAVCLLGAAMVSLPVLASSSINIYGPGATSSSPTFDKILFTGSNCTGVSGFQLCADGSALTFFVNGTTHWTYNYGTGVFRDIIGGFSTPIGSGSNAYAVETNGARVDFGAGASDYASSDGTTVTFAGPVAVTGNTSTSNITMNGSTTLNVGAGSIVTAGAGTQYRNGNNPFNINTAPTISSGFGTSPSITSSNGTAAFTINVGTGGVANSGVIGLPAATTGWVCMCDDLTTPGVNETKMTATSTTTCTVQNFNTTTGAAAAWAASDILHCIAMGR